MHTEYTNIYKKIQNIKPRRGRRPAGPVWRRPADRTESVGGGAAKAAWGDGRCEQGRFYKICSVRQLDPWVFIDTVEELVKQN